jgi:hypothetical protein
MAAGLSIVYLMSVDYHLLAILPYLHLWEIVGTKAMGNFG